MKVIGMSGLRRFLIRLAGLFHKGRREQEMAEELESHLQMHVDENLRCGMSAEQAWRFRLPALLRTRTGVLQTEPRL